MKPFLVTLGALLAFIATALFVDPDTMTEVLSIAVLFAAAWGLVRWGAAAGRAYVRGASTVEEQGVIGIVLLLFSIIVSRVYSVTYLALDRPLYLQVLHIAPFLVYMTFVALILFISATRYEGERPTRLGGAIAGIIAFIAVMFSPLWPIIVAKLGALVSILLRAI